MDNKHRINWTICVCKSDERIAGKYCVYVENGNRSPRSTLDATSTTIEYFGL